MAESLTAAFDRLGLRPLEIGKEEPANHTSDRPAGIDRSYRVIRPYDASGCGFTLPTMEAWDRLALAVRAPGSRITRGGAIVNDNLGLYVHVEAVLALTSYAIGTTCPHALPPAPVAMTVVETPRQCGPWMPSFDDLDGARLFTRSEGMVRTVRLDGRREQAPDEADEVTGRSEAWNLLSALIASGRAELEWDGSIVGGGNDLTRTIRVTGPAVGAVLRFCCLQPVR